MKILLAATPATGHLNPLLGIARMLTNRGHETLIYTGWAFRDRVMAVGSRHVSLPPAIDFDLSNMDAAFPGRSALAGVELLQHDFEKIFVGPMVEQFAGLARLVDSFRPDVVIADQLFLGAVPLMLAPRESRPIVAACGVTFLTLPREDGIPHGLGIPFLATAEQRSAALAQIPPEAATAFAPVQRLYEASLRSLGVTPRGDPMSAAACYADVFWQAGVPEIDYPNANLLSHVHYVGRWPSIPAPVKLPEWMETLNDGRRIVLVTQGTVANADLDQLVLPTMRALANRNDLLVIGTGGGADVAHLEDKLPLNARIARYLPFDLVLPRVHALVTNGGFGTVAQALSAGVPLVVAGDTEDKPETAARVQWSGAGIDLRTSRPSEAVLAQAIQRTLNDHDLRRRAHRVADAFGRHDSEQIIEETLLAELALQRQVA